MPRVSVAAALSLALLVVPQSGRAQQRDLTPGMRVRVTALTIFASRYEAVIGTRRGETLSLVRGDASPIDVPLAAATRIDVGGGKDRWAGARRGALWGAGIGVALFAFAAMGPGEVVQERLCTGATCSSSDIEAATALAAGGLLWGAAIGAVIGRDRWQQVTPILPSRGSRGAVAPDGMRLGLRVGF